MATDLTRPLKAAVIDHLAASPSLLSLVPADRIYAMSPPATPLFPFVRYGVPISSGFDATCWDGATVRVTLHAFAESTQTRAGEDLALDIAAAMVEAMKVFEPSNLGVIECEWMQTNCRMEDLEADRWHAFCEFSVTVIEPS